MLGCFKTLVESRSKLDQAKMQITAYHGGRRSPLSVLASLQV